MSQGSHTIVLIQYATSYQSRSYLDFPTVPAAMDGKFMIQMCCSSPVTDIPIHTHSAESSNFSPPRVIFLMTTCDFILIFFISYREDVRAQAEGIEPVSAAYHLRHIRSIQLHRQPP